MTINFLECIQKYINSFFLLTIYDHYSFLVNTNQSQHWIFSHHMPVTFLYYVASFYLFTVQPVISNTVFIFLQCIQWHQTQFLPFYSVLQCIQYIKHSCYLFTVYPSNTVFTFLQCIQWHQTLFLQLTKGKQFRVT